MNTKRKTTRVEGGSPFLRGLIGFLAAIVEIALVVRLLLKLFGVSSNSMITELNKYTDYLVKPFQGFAKDIEVASLGGIFEPATVIAIILVALIAGILSAIFKGRKVTVEEEQLPTESRNEAYLQNTELKKPEKAEPVVVNQEVKIDRPESFKEDVTEEIPPVIHHPSSVDAAQEADDIQENVRGNEEYSLPKADALENSDSADVVEASELEEPKEYVENVDVVHSTEMDSTEEIENINRDEHKNRE